MSKKITIVMTAFNRNELATNSINSIIEQNYPNYHIVVVDDCSTIPFKYEHENVTVIRTENRKWVSQVVVYNTGLNYVLKHINPDIIFIQNAEAYHYGKLLQYADDNLSNDNYLSFACLSLDEVGSKDITQDKVNSLKNVHIASGDESIGWYNHSIYYPRYFDFCAAVTKDNMIKLNGFDERYAKHYWFCDNNLVDRVSKLGLNAEIVDYPFVVHQWHNRNHQTHGYTKEAAVLFNKTCLERGYKAEHIYTDDLC